VTGRKEQAREQYQKALAARPDDVNILRQVVGFYIRTGQPEDAEPLLRRLLDSQTKVSPEDIAWARRDLAMVLMVRNQYQRRQEALGLIEKNLQADGGTPDDRRLKAVLLAAQPGERREAIRSFEELSKRQPPTPEEGFVLAQLYMAEGDRQNARMKMLSILASRGDNPLYLATYANQLLDWGETGEATTWFNRLERIEPKALRTAVIKARLLKAEGKEGEAVALLKASAASDKGNVGPVAVVLEQLGQADAAEEMYRRSAAQSPQPEALLTLAAFLGRQGRTSDALDCCERARRTCPPENVAETCVKILFAAKVDDAQCRRVGHWLEEAIQSNPDALPLQFDLANVYILQGRYRDAKAIYQRLGERGANLAAPLNNLAWILAIQEGKGAEALDLVDRAIATTGPMPGLLDTRALAHMAMHRSDLAIKDLDQAIATGDSAILHFHLAQAYLMSKDRRAAAQALEKAKALGFKDSILHPLEQSAYRRLIGELAQR
jgi:tetratricopeptide (TPR) repeat protein